MMCDLPPPELISIAKYLDVFDGDSIYGPGNASCATKCALGHMCSAGQKIWFHWRQAPAIYWWLELRFRLSFCDANQLYWSAVSTYILWQKRFSSFVWYWRNMCSWSARIFWCHAPLEAFVCDMADFSIISPWFIFRLTDSFNICLLCTRSASRSDLSPDSRSQYARDNNKTL